jgi:hypothetical protein
MSSARWPMCGVASSTTSFTGEIFRYDVSGNVLQPDDRSDFIGPDAADTRSFASSAAILNA